MKPMNKNEEKFIASLMPDSDKKMVQRTPEKVAPCNPIWNKIGWAKFCKILKLDFFPKLHAIPITTDIVFFCLSLHSSA